MQEGFYCLNFGADILSTSVGKKAPMRTAFLSINYSLDYVKSVGEIQEGITSLLGDWNSTAKQEWKNRSKNTCTSDTSMCAA